MFFKQLPTKESSLSYFFGCAGPGLVVAVDAVAGMLFDSLHTKLLNLPTIVA